MGDMTDPAGFYEDDEPLEKIEAAFERGVKRITTRPADHAPVAFSCNQRLHGPTGGNPSATIAAAVTRTGR